jgi:hypothetical protein
VEIVYAVVGVAVLVVVLYDAIVTTVAADTATGPVTHRLALLMWGGFRRIASGPGSRPMLSAGPVIIVVMILFWLVGIWFGWALIFLSDPGAVISTRTGEPADLWARIYYAGFSVFTLGIGDYRPGSPLWQVLTPAATINGFGLVTLVVSYLIPLLSAVNDERSQSALISSLGRTPAEILLNAWDGESFSYLEGPFAIIAREAEQTGQRHLTYPVLHFFHSSSRDAAFEPSLATLDEAVTILERGVAEEVRPHTAALRSVRRAVDQLLNIVTPDFSGASEEAPPPPDLGPLAERGVPLAAKRDFDESVAELDQHRRRLRGFVEDALWGWEEHVQG